MNPSRRTSGDRPGGGVSRVLGVDPGMGSTGFGIIEIGGSGSCQYRESGVIRPRSLLTSHRIQQIFRGLIRLIEEFKPEKMAVERPFCGKNVKSAMLLGQARGAAILAAAETGVEVQEYSPLEVKQAVVGYGRAAKEQIEAMVRSLLSHPGRLNSHAADALAVALCLAHQMPWHSLLASPAGNRAGQVAGRRARTSEEGP